jgi:hypothetical protein
MKSSRLSRIVVASVTAVVLLLCQTAALAQACVMASAAHSKTSAAAMPCHTASDDAGDVSHQPATPSVCDASKALAEIAKVPVFALADIPVFVIASHDFVPRLGSGIPRATQAVCSSPPLPVLHCRFLI